MRRIFVGMPPFEREWVRLGLSDGIRRDLESTLLQDPKAGVLIQGTGGIRKIRHALPGRGKSGSLRVFFYDYAAIEHLFLLAVISKSEADNLTMPQRQTLRQAVKATVLNYESTRRSQM